MLRRAQSLEFCLRLAGGGMPYWVEYCAPVLVQLFFKAEPTNGHGMPCPYDDQRSGQF